MPIFLDNTTGSAVSITTDNTWGNDTSVWTSNDTVVSFNTASASTTGWDYSVPWTLSGSDTSVSTVDDLTNALWQDLVRGTLEWQRENNVPPTPFAWQGDFHVNHKPQRTAAQKRAHELLMQHLTPHQQREYSEKGFFHVTTPRKHKYRIYRGSMGNVYRLNRRGKPIRSFCLHIKRYCPDEDTMLTQLLMLLTDEERFLKIANHRTARRRAWLEPLAA